MVLGPVVGIGEAGRVHVVAEVPVGTRPELEVREERSQPVRWTDLPGSSGWTASSIGAVGRERIGGSVYRFPIDGLRPDRGYRYRLLDAATGQEIDGFQGRFRPPPRDLTEPASFLVTSCNKDEVLTRELYEHVWRRLAVHIDRDPTIRFLLHVGDQIYCDSAWDPVHAEFRDAGMRTRSRAQRREWYRQQRPKWVQRFRRRYRTAWQPEPVRRVLRSVPNLMMWDDHDLHDGYGSRATDYWTFAPPLADVAKETFGLYQGSLNPAPNLGNDNHAFSIRLLGGGLIVLDTRSVRDARKGRRQVLGRSQWHALRQALAAHQADDGPLFVVSSVPVFNFLLAKGAIAKLIRKIASLTELSDDLRDAWGSKANRAEQGRLVETLMAVRVRRVRPLVLLCGDIHVHHLTHWFRKTSEARCVHQVTSSPLTNEPVSKKGVSVVYGRPEPHEPLDFVAGFRAKVDWFANRRGYAQITLRPGVSGPEVAAVYHIEPELGDHFIREQPVVLG